METPERPQYYKLTGAQAQLLIGVVFSLEPKKVFEDNLIDFGLYEKEDFDPDAMEKAYNCLIRRNDSLRIRLCIRPGGIRQYIAPYEEVKLPRVPVADRSAFLESVMRKSSMPLFSGSLIRAVILPCGGSRRSGGLHILCHHIISDGYSMDMIHRDLFHYYRSFKEGREPEPEKEYSITDYFLADRKYRKGKAFREDRKWWFHAYNHQPHYSFPAGRIPWKCELAADERVIEGETYEKLLSLSRTLRCSLPALIMSLTAVTVYTLTGEDNFCLYALTHGRSTAKLRRTMGCMINSVPQFYEIQPELSVGSYLEKTYSDYLVMLSHSRYPSSSQILMAAKETYIKRFGYNHMWFLFSAMDYLDEKEVNGLELITPPEVYITGQFYEAFLNEGQKHRCRIQLSYQARSFSREAVTHMLNAFSEVLRLTVNDPSLTLSALREAVPARTDRQ